MFLSRKTACVNSYRSVSLVVVTCLCLPLIIFEVNGIEVPLTFILIPFLIVSIATSKNLYGILFLLLTISGLISVIVVSEAPIDNRVLRPLASLCLFLFSISFIFLGRKIAKNISFGSVIVQCGLISSVYVLVVTAANLFTGRPFRTVTGPEGFATLNADFFGFSSFGSYGVLSLSSLILLQICLMIASLFISKSRTVSALLFAGIFSGSWLVTSSISRTVQMSLIFLILVIVIYASAKVGSRKILLLCLLTIVGGSLFSVAQNPIVFDRVTDTLTSFPTSSPTSTLTELGREDNAESTEPVKELDLLSSGRLSLIQTASFDIRKSPFFGTGFRSTSLLELGSSSTHVYFLTVLWKGGTFFLLLMIIFLGGLSVEGVKRFKECGGSPELFFTFIAVLLAFVPLSLTWDLLLVPSAGSLAFFLLGVLSVQRDFVSRDEFLQYDRGNK